MGDPRDRETDRQASSPGRRAWRGITILLSMLLAAPAQAAWWNPFGSDECLGEVEKAARSHQTCLVLQIVPGQCDEPTRALANATTVCKKKVDAETVDALIKKTRSLVRGDPKKSPYARITRSLKRSPYLIVPQRENYLPFTNKCRDSRTSYFKIGAYHVDGDRITFLAYPLGFRCANRKSISDRFPIVTAEQLRRLGKGEYLKRVPASRRPFKTARIVRTTAAGLKAAYARIKAGKPAKPPAVKRYALTVTTQPENARVRILNIDGDYRPGMRLPAGRYHLEVSAPGFTTRRQWISIGNNDHELSIALAPSRAPAISGLPCAENADQISVSTVRIAPFNECHFITYPDERSRDLAITNLRSQGSIHDVQLEVTYYDEDREVVHQEKYILFRAANRQAIAPGETRFPFTGIYLKRDGVVSIGIKTLAFSVSN